MAELATGRGPINDLPRSKAPRTNPIKSLVRTRHELDIVVVSRAHRCVRSGGRETLEEALARVYGAGRQHLRLRMRGWAVEGHKASAVKLGPSIS